MKVGLTRAQDTMNNKTDFVEIGLACADVCSALDRGTNGKNLDDLSTSVRVAIDRLMKWVKLAVRGLDSSLTVLLIAGLWRRSGRRSWRRVDGTHSPGLSTRGMIRI